ncbi:MAG: GIY-YIG nuclease family protein [Candidatus Magasanikbacteria bacterium]|nr:GIY-YIG nuclease family protein [Candidatus Magasanikbacteria bacterium]
MNEKIEQKLQQLPDAPGVYLFFNIKKELIYVGKASSLKNRVRSYFAGKKSPRPIEEMIHEVVDLKTENTDSALEAAILEGFYIKKYRPKYNVQWRDDKSWNYIGITKEAFSKVKTVRQHELTSDKKTEFKYLFGPYPGLNTKAAMKILRKLFFISTCEPNAKRPCFYYQLGECLGVCTGEISALDYLNKVIRPLCLFLGGKKRLLVRKIEKDMLLTSIAENFEEAGRLRNQLHQLKKIQDIALLNDSFMEDKIGNNTNLVKRIEGYDISNLGSSDKVGSMVVFDEAGPVKSEYRKFKIKTVVGQSDVDCLVEVLERRLQHTEWPMPNIFLIDGGLPQINKAKKVLDNFRIHTTIVGIAKGSERKRNDFFVLRADDIMKEWIKNNKLLLIKVRDEAHRFAITFNRAQRKLKY